MKTEQQRLKEQRDMKRATGEFLAVLDSIIGPTQVKNDSSLELDREPTNTPFICVAQSADDWLEALGV